MAKDPYKYFRLEARELLTQLGSAALELEKSGNGQGQVQRLLRLAHTLKGAARVVKQAGIADQAHAIEEVLTPFRESAGSVPRESIEAVLRLADGIGEWLNGLTQSGDSAPETKAAAVTASVPEESLRTVRAEVAEVDSLLNGVTEAYTLLGSLRFAPQALERGQHLASLLLEQLGPRGGADGAATSAASRSRAFATAQDLRKSLMAVIGRLGTVLDQVDRELVQVREAAEQMRLVGAGSLFPALDRTARDSAAALGRRAEFRGAGGETRLDAHVLELVHGALVQIVRNAVAHGIEPESERRAAGKPAAGQVSLSVLRRGQKIVFTCRDDGRGIDLETVRRMAAERGLLRGDAASWGAEELIGALMRGGISTSDKVTEVSGRGIGLDVVRDAVGKLGGEVVVRTAAGKGTTFELVVPYSVVSLETLAVEAAGNVLTFPLEAVRTVRRVASAEISWSAGGATMVHDGKAIPFVSLPQALYGSHPPAERSWPTAVVAAQGELAAVGVDNLLGIQRAVIRPLSDLTPVAAVVAGASLDAEGNPQLVLDPDGLVALARRGITAELEPAAAGAPILVVDDSLTTRMLEQSILESAGYAVDLAASGEEGIEAVRRKRYALILCDVEMPGMDGFAFVETIRSNPATHDIPAILVTSRAAPSDIERGRDVRAQGYVIKSEFDQTKLLEMVRSLTG